jgi:hypothetical protein
MADRDDRKSPPASGMRADPPGHRTRSDAGWPQHTEAAGETPENQEHPENPEHPENTDAVEQDPPVRKAIDDDTSAAVFTGHDAEDRGPLAPEFREPTDSGG